MARRDAVLARDAGDDDQVDLGVGVYKDRDGRTPVMRAVREAEKRLLASQDTKTYLGLAGDTGFNTAMIKLALGETADLSRVRAAQAPGGVRRRWAATGGVGRRRAATGGDGRRRVATGGVEFGSTGPGSGIGWPREAELDRRAFTTVGFPLIPPS